jgi:predicted AAA+ superfamily ATPase
MLKKVYQRKCVTCKEKFTPQANTQICCSPWCAIEYTKKKKTKEADKVWKTQKSELKESLKTKSDYEKELQKEINTIVRLIDKGSFCHSTKKPLNDKFDAGHFYSVGSNNSIRFNLFNIYAQSVYANQYLSGDQINFLNVLSEVYGIEHKEYVLSLKGLYTYIKLSIEDLKEKIVIAKQIVKELKKSDLIYPAKMRLQLRKVYNDRIGIYN